MRSVTKQAVKEARLKEIKQELLNSEKLKVSPAHPSEGRGLSARSDQASLLSLRPTSTTTPETCSCSVTTKTCTPPWSSPT